MKKLILAIAFLTFGMTSMAQDAKPMDEKYMTTMKGLIMKMSAAQSAEAYDAAGNGFERIVDAKPTEWLPKYYAAYCKVMSAFTAEEKGETDNKIDAAEKLISAAETVPNSELICLRGMCHQARMGVDPMTRGRQYGPLASELLTNAAEVDPLNPRPDFLKGQSAFYTPEAFGGGKKIAKKFFQSAIDKFAKFKPSNELMPTWGLEATKVMLAKCDK